MQVKNGTMRILILCTLILLGVSGCSLYNSIYDSFFGAKDVAPVEVLVQEGMEEYEDGNYKTALEKFQQIKDWYPFSKYVMLAELKIADSHYRLEEYEDAVFAYQEFADLHPNNEAIPYVLYQIGRCYFDRMDTIDRDQSVTRRALEVFQQLQKQHPNSIYAEKAADHIHLCLKSLAGNEFYIAMFYFNSKHYDAALERFKAVVEKYPDVGVQQIALQYITKCESTLAEKSAPE